MSWLQRLAFPDHYKHLVHPLEPPSMISVDPPAHTRYRKLVARAFSVKKVEALAPGWPSSPTGCSTTCCGVHRPT
jgi:cytochrome P450